MSQEHPDDLQFRILALLDGTLDQEEVTRLDAELRESREARQLYQQLATLHSSLEDQGLSQSDLDCAPVIPIDLLVSRQRRRIVKISLLAAAAVMLISAVVFWMTQVPHSPATLADFEAAPDSVITLTHTGDGVSPRGNVLAEGSSVVIEHGVVELDLPHEVLAVIEAPAAITLVDARTLQLDHGRAFFQVSSEEGNGFTVITPQQQIVDLGTAFGVDSRLDRDEVELHVFEGRVRVDDLDGGAGEVIRAKRSVLLSGTQIKQDLDGPPAAFRRKLPTKVEMLLHEDFESGLVGGRDYAVQIDSTAILDLKGNRFRGIDDEPAWRFATQTTATGITINNAGFEHANGIGGNGNLTTVEDWIQENPVKVFVDDNGLHWTPEADRTLYLSGAGTAVNQDLNHQWASNDIYILGIVGIEPQWRMATQGDAFRVQLRQADGTVLWDSGSTSVEGTVGGTPGKVSYTGAGHQFSWTIDASKFAGTGVVKGSPLNIRIAQEGGAPYLDDVSLDIPGTYSDGADLSDWLETILEEDARTDSGDEQVRDYSPPVLMALRPAADSSDAVPGGPLTMVFDEPVKFGGGRIFLQNISDRTVSEILVGGPRTSVDGRVVTISPPSNLKDGEMHLGLIGEWEGEAWVGILNPSGDGTWYAHEDLEDKGKRRSRGSIGSMRGPAMATFNELRPGVGIRHQLGQIAPESRYTVSAAIGVRDTEARQSATFLGYTIRLVSGDTILAELSEDTPPGQPNSVTSVGFSWDSSTLPEGLAPGTPLAIEIAPNDASGLDPGYLDLDNVRVTVVGE